MKRKYSLLGFVWLLVNELTFAGEPYINRIFEYVPAPGQYINTPSSAWEKGYIESQVLDYANELLANADPGMVLLSLGSFGGYIVAGFDHTIVNLEGEYDFKIYGNAVYSKRPTLTGKPGGSAEPGIVMVSVDTNGNGLPDDEWYELAGSEYRHPLTLHDYEITYYRPESPDEPVRWTDNRNGQGYVPRNDDFHTQPYYPEWYTSDQISFRGTRLPDNAVNEGTGGEDYWVLYCYDWGYADNHPNRTEMCQFKIEWAVDKNGDSVQLPGIDFIKVYTGLLQAVGDLGESSTEISGIEDLHPDAILNSLTPENAVGITIINPFENELQITLPDASTAALYNAAGGKVGYYLLSAGYNAINVSCLPRGFYTLVLTSGEYRHSYKIMKK